MEIVRRPGPDVLTIAVKGRLDSHWSKTLTDELNEAIRAGSHRLELDCAELNYVSSAGIRVLLRAYKDLKAINGAFTVVNPSPAVRTVLKLGAMEMLLAPEVKSAPAAGAERTAPAPLAAAGPAVAREESASAVYEVHRRGAGGHRCTAHGRPEGLAARTYAEGEAHEVEFSAGKVGLGLGAFGENFAECRERFGEFVAAAGAAAYLPGDGTKTADFSVASGALVPRVQALYALECEGEFDLLARFEVKPDHRAVPFSELAAKALELAGTPHAVVVAVAESAGLVGAFLKKTPVEAAATGSGGASPGNLFAHPGVREWLTFTAERGYARTLPLVAGVVSAAPEATLDRFLRPWPGTAHPELRAHFHAAVFGYQPLKKGWLDLAPTVAGLFDSENVLALLHLLADTREYLGVGESEFIRGALWISPLTSIQTA